MDDKTEAWAVVIRDLLHCVPPEKRLAVLGAATEWETANQAEMGKIKSYRASDLENSPGLRHWHTVMEYKSRIVSGSPVPSATITVPRTPPRFCSPITTVA